MEKKVGKNYLYNLSYQLLLVILPLITTPYLSRVLGASGVGTYGYTNSVIQYFTLFGCIGLTLYGQREIAYYQNNIERRNKTFLEISLLRIITMSISIIFFYIVIIPNSSYHDIFFIQTLDLIAAMFDISWFFQGIEDFRKIVIRNFIIRILCVMLIFLVVKRPDDLLLYVFCYSCTIFLGNISLWLYMPRYIKKSDFKDLNLKKHFRQALSLFVPQIAMSLYVMLDKTMIGLITNDTSEVAYYEQSQTIIKTVMTLITSLSTAMMPRIANLYKSDDISKVKELMSISIIFVLVLALPFVFGIIAIAPGFVTWFFGKGFEKVVPNMIIISPIILFTGLSTVLGTQYLLALGRQKQYTISVVIGSCTNVLLNILLITYLKSIGAAIATLAAESMVCIIQLYFVRKEFDLKFLLKSFIKYMSMSICMYCIVKYASTKMTTNIISTIIEILIGGIVYVILLIVTKDAIYKYIRNKIKGEIK